ncbi:MAG: PDZ domain-containing protein [Planctomycetia bacterium]|nr:PDZ domain-containing protein [Planctomycetia bacterium]
MKRLSVCLLLVAGCCVVLASDIPPPRKVDVAALVRQLGSDDFQEREAATEKLASLAVDEPPAELLAALKSPDPEVRGRAAKAIKAIRDRAALKRLPRDERFAARGQVDLYVASTAALNLKPEDERLWAPAMCMGAKAVTLAEMKGDRMPGGPVVYQSFDKYQAELSAPKFVRTAGMYTRPKQDGKGELICAYQVAVQATEVKAEWALVGLIVSRGPVNAKADIQRSLILATDDITVGESVSQSVIICDGDVVVPRNVMKSLIIARGKIEIKEMAESSTLITGGKVAVGKLPDIGIPPNPLDTPAALEQWKIKITEAESKKVIVKDKEPNPLGFITFFELSRIGLEVKAADGVVQVAKLEAGTLCEKAGFQVGDTILEVNGKKPTDAESLRRLLRDALAIADATVKLQRGDKTETLKVALPE